jgi:hypothetical protein
MNTTMSPGLRRLTFTTHLTTSLGWAGAVLVFLALAAIGLTSDDAIVVRGAYLLMAPAAWFVLVPLGHASLISGIVLSVGTKWGLFKHYWVVSKLVLTAFATVILLVYMGTFRQMAGVAADPVVDIAAVRNASPLIHSVLAFILLTVTTVLGVYKPFGMTAYGRRVYEQRRGDVAEGDAFSGVAVVERSAFPSSYVLAAFIVLIVLALTVLHLLGSGFRH